MKWFHIMTGSFKIKRHTLFWRFGWEKDKRKDISRWGREEIFHYVRKLGNVYSEEVIIGFWVCDQSILQFLASTEWKL